MDDIGHGTHVAGILGAVGNNGRGGTGVAWKVQLMACKFIGSTGEGATSDAIRCLDYARLHGAQVVNCSWGNTVSSTSLLTAFQRLRDSGIVVAVAAGNDSRDNDVTPDYPASYNLDNIVSVVATTSTDTLADFSNYGRISTDLGAPGVGIRSTWFTSDQAYSTQSGTSMAAPVVSGMLALLRARFPTETPAQLIERLLTTSDSLPGLQGRCVSGGRANLQRAVSESMVVGFTASTWQGSPPLVVQFTNTTRGTQLALHWDFGDGSSSTESSPVHTYTTEGNFTVRLDVTGAGGQSGSKSQTVSVVGNYSIAASPYAWIDPTAMTRIPLGDNSVSSAQPLPFPFPFYGQTYNSIRIGANGILGFAPDGLGTTSNTGLPSAGLPNGIICPYWDNLNPGAGGSVRAGTTGASPQRRYVVSWVDVPLNQASLKFTFQAILEEESGIIRFQYLQVQPGNSRGGGRRASVGIEDQTGLIAARYLVDGSPVVLTNQQALAFQPGFAAGLRVTPSDRTTSSGPVGGPFNPASARFNIANAGARTLTWHATHAAPWLELSPSSGILTAGQSVEISARLNDNALTLAAGSYLDAIDLVNEVNGLGNTTREFSLIVNGGAGLLTITPDTGLEATGTVGGPFSPSATVYTVANTGDATLSWAASTEFDWTEVSTHGGTLGPGETTSLRIGFGTPANDLGAGHFEDSLAFTNLTNGRGGGVRVIQLATTAATSSAEMRATRSESGEIVLTIQGQPGASYLLEQSLNLLTWIGLSRHTLPADGIASIPAFAPVGPATFYRASLVP